MGFETLKTQPDRLWMRVLAEVDELNKEYRQQYRSTAFRRDKAVLCVYKGYGKEIDDGTGYTPRYVFNIEAYEDRYGVVQSRIDGPFEDCADDYWTKQREADNGDRGFFVSDNWVHYTIHKDSTNGILDGFGGHQFLLEFANKGEAKRFEKLGFDVTYGPNGQDPSMAFMKTRNMWEQGIIPPKHRHLWTPTGKVR